MMIMEEGEDKSKIKKKIQKNIVRSYVKLQEESDDYDPLSRKIVNRLNI